MMIRLLEQEAAVSVVLSSALELIQKDLSPNTDLVRHASVGIYSKTFSPISEVTDFLSGVDHVTALFVLPLLYNLKARRQIAGEDDTMLTKDINKAVLEDLHAQSTDASVLCVLATASLFETQFKIVCVGSEDKAALRTSFEEQEI